MFAVIKMELSGKTVYGPVLKTTQLSAHRQNSLPSAVGRLSRAKISGRRGRPSGIFFGFYKTRHIFLSDGATRTVLCAVVLTQYRRVTEGQTDGRTELL